MKTIRLLLLCAVIVAFSVTALVAQPPGRGPRWGGPPGRGGGPPSPPDGPRMAVIPLIVALDVDKDRKISAAEIEKAAESLKSLDKDGNGDLTIDELRPDFARRGPQDARPGARRGGGPPADRARPPFGGRGPRGERFGPGPAGRPPVDGVRPPFEGRGPRAGRFGPGPGGPPPADEARPPREGRGPRGEGFGPGRGAADFGPPSPEQFVKRLMTRDANEDGKLSKDELPERMQRIFDRADTNDDGVLDKSEVKAIAERFAERRGRGRPESARPLGPPAEGGRRYRPEQ